MKKIKIVCLATFILLLGTFVIEQLEEKPAAQELWIHEVVTANGSVIDGDGDYSDWIEIYNSGNETIDLTGYYLSDDTSQPLRWRFPETEIQPDSYVVVYASGKDKVMNDGELHTNFKLDCMGETISLSDPEGMSVSVVRVPEVSFDHSYGLFEGTYVEFDSGTLGEANIQKQSILTKGSKPVEYSVPAGNYAEDIYLELTTEEEHAVIYYTLDGSIPSEESMQYDGSGMFIGNRTWEENRYTSVWCSPNDWDGQEGFSYNPNPQYKATVVRTRLYFPDEKRWSEDVWTNTYLIGAGYALPIVSLSVDEADLFDESTGICVPGEEYQNYLETTAEINPEPRLRTGNYSFNRKVPGYLEYYEAGGKIMEQKITMRVCGKLSRGNGMKSFSVDAWGDDRNGVFSYPIFGEDYEDINGKPIHTFTGIRLRNFGNDWRRSKIRDGLSQSLVTGMGFGTQAYQPAILLINGEYYGLVEIREERDAMFFERHFGIPKENYQEVEIKDLRIETATEVEKEFLELIHYAETHDLSLTEHYEYVDERLDIPLLLDYILVQLYLQNLDWYDNNCIFYRNIHENRDDGVQVGKWRVLLYDMDYAINYEQENNYAMFFESDYYCAKLLRALLQNEECKNYFIERFEELLENNFESSRAIAIQRQMEEEIEPYIAEDLARWDVYENGTLVKTLDISYWYEKMEDLRRFFTDRLDYAREYFYSTFY